MIRNDTNLLPGVPLIESPFFSDHFSFEDTPAQIYQAACQLNRQGFAIIDFPEPNFDEISDKIKKDLIDIYDWDEWKRNGGGLRVQDAWKFSKEVYSLAVNAKIIEIISQIYGRKAFPFQTLNFPVGTEQPFHSDSVHFSSIPERFMCGVWVALEDISVNAGPVLYYPGSHKFPIYVNEHIGHTHVPGTKSSQTVFEPMWRKLVASNNLNPERLLIRKGQALIWAANLLHGGDRHRDQNLTRWSQVTHYYFEGCSYYTPMESDPALGNIYFRTPSNILEGDDVKNVYNGQFVPEEYIQSVSPTADNLLPSNFDANLYLVANPDVAAAGIDPAQHYLVHGKKEGRAIRP
ncbi:MAG: phytanoyl-CoA dioxygenase family protein [Negativicutes bacterium]|nr:phytanoyl-CoA dioxygenase family protein [Negativicutes bacterium]